MVDEGGKTALVVVGNPIIEGQLKRSLYKRGWSAEITEDGDSAVDKYVSIRPNLVFMAVDIPTLDGHIAALEMRESDRAARIVFVTSKTGQSIAEDAAYSSGAVGVLLTPITESAIEEAWDQWMGRIPDAPGLSDLDALYPKLETPEPEIPPPPPLLPPLDSLSPSNPESSEVELPTLSPLPQPISPSKPKKKRRWLRILLLMTLIGASVAGAQYTEVIDLTEYIEQIQESLGII
jgi:CheY-like chemotaxis protein